MEFLIIGGLFRRYWGGWYQPNGILKRVMLVMIAVLTCYLRFGMSWIVLAIAPFIVFGFLMPKHGYGISMGRYEPHPLWACITVMTAQYLGLTALAGITWEFIQPNTGGLIYAFMGALVPLGYYLSWIVWERFNLKPWGEYPKGNVFIDGPCAYAELILGATLLGGIWV